MVDRLQQLLDGAPALRRLAWRLGRRLYTSARGEPLRNAIASNGEAWVQACIVRQLRPDEHLVAFDIGANEGEWTRSLIEALPEGLRTAEGTRIEAFEPVPETIRRLEASIDAAGGAGFARVNRLALSDRTEHVAMTIMSDTGGTNSLHGDGAPGTGRSIEIETETLDAFCAAQGITHIHLAKCDTEGHDLSVLRGARGMLAAGAIGAFQFEYNHRWIYNRAFLKDVFDLVAGLPYVLGRIRPSAIELLPAWHPELDRFFEANYLLIHERTRKAFRLVDGRFDGSNTYRA